MWRGWWAKHLTIKQNRKLEKWNQRIDNPIYSKSIWKNLLSIAWKSLILSFFAFLLVLPFYFMIILSLTSNQKIHDSASDVILFPDGLHWENFYDAIKTGGKYGYWSALGVSILTTAASVTFRIYFTIFFGYAFSIKKWRFKKILWVFFLSLYLLPETTLLVGQLKIIYTLEWQTGPMVLASLFLPFLNSISNGLLIRNAFENIPSEIKEAAMLDNCAGLKFVWKVAIPMIKPTIWTIGILTAFSAWNSFIWPNILFSSISSNNFQTLPLWGLNVGIPEDITGDEIRINMATKMAGAILMILPMFIIFFICRKKIMNAISRQGSTIKG